MDVEDANWVIQWRYHPEGLDKWLGNPWNAQYAVAVDEKKNPKKYFLRWHNTAHYPDKSPDYLYSVSSMKAATHHTVEEAMQLWFAMRNNWKFNERMDQSWHRPRMVRLYNVVTKEEIFPAQIDPGCIG